MSLLVSTVASALTGSAYAFVGWRMSARRVSSRARLAQRCFVSWWLALSAISLASVVLQLLYLADGLPLWLYRAFMHLALLALVGALAALLYYLVFLYTGSTDAWKLPMAYAIMAAVLVALLLSRTPHPTSITDDGWRLEARPEADLPAAAGAVLSLLVLGPQVAAAIAYALLWRHAPDPTTRYRIGLVSASIIVWFSSSILAGLTDIGDSVAWQVASRLLSLAAAIGILLAYQPPKSWQDRWGLRSITSEPAPVD